MTVYADLCPHSVSKIIHSVNGLNPALESLNKVRCEFVHSTETGSQNMTASRSCDSSNAKERTAHFLTALCLYAQSVCVCECVSMCRVYAELI